MKAQMNGDDFKAVVLISLIFLVLAWFSLRVPFLQPYHFDWDSAQFTLATQEFNVVQHKPHPPGYPLWVLSIKVLQPLIGSPATAQVVCAICFTALALWGYFKLACDLCGRVAAWWSTFLLAFLPPVQLYASVQSVYTVDLAASAWLGWFCARTLSGESKKLIWAAGAAAVLMGFRQTGPMLLGLMLLAAAVTVARRREWKTLLVAAGVGSALTALWYIPLAQMSGGVQQLTALTSAQFRSVLPYTSILYGASFMSYIDGLARQGGFVLAWFLPMATAVLAVLLFSRRSSSINAPHAAPCWHRWWFYTAAIGPCVAVNTLLHCPKTGYYALVVPPVLLLGTRFLVKRAVGKPFAYWLPPSVMAAVMIVLLTYVPFYRLDTKFPASKAVAIGIWQSSPAWADAVLQSKKAIEQYIEYTSGLRPNQVAFALYRPASEAPNQRSISVDFPQIVQLIPENGRTIVMQGHRINPTSELPGSVQAILWVTFPVELDRTIFEAFPLTRLALANELCRVYRSDLGTGSITKTVNFFGMPLRIKRDSEPGASRLGGGSHRQEELSPSEWVALGAEDSTQYLGTGWSIGEQTGRWTVGPSSTLRFRMPAGSRGILKAESHTIFPDREQRVRVFVNGVQRAEWVWTRQNEAQVVEVPIEPDADGFAMIELRPQGTMRPGPHDRRELGIYMRYFFWEAR